MAGGLGRGRSSRSRGEARRRRYHATRCGGLGAGGGQCFRDMGKPAAPDAWSSLVARATCYTLLLVLVGEISALERGRVRNREEEAVVRLWGSMSITAPGATRLEIKQGGLVWQVWRALLPWKGLYLGAAGSFPSFIIFYLLCSCDRTQFLTTSPRLPSTPRRTSRRPVQREKQGIARSCHTAPLQHGDFP